MNLLKELLHLQEAAHERDDAGKTHESPDGVVVVTVDFQDPEERELTIWVKGATSKNEAMHIIENPPYDKFIEEILQPFDLSIYDAGYVDAEEVDGGISLHTEFPPEDEDD